ncbi:gamma-glutamyl-gamma-aminobutyrate hydrolase family protein [Phycicoccus sp. Soil803]|uniref:gamma-glutamyl-gamma-aminobutyrate hydrolase family protein n=1 Tax=Phycicoccus sp. Soil803 TaxID=1736415 RepID=UPI000710CFB3|nr:type 1 glutamine amidotransferase [Phycicoccus sp. Soil803]KRF23169.1 peptidase C26 [Phycicoccus sp. Soil803]
MSGRPLIIVPARFSESASALRFRAEVTARALATAVFDAGGEPVTVHPHARDGLVDEGQVADRFDFADGVLLPGGGDITPALYGGLEHGEHYDMDPEQDAFDLAVARWALRTGRPVLAICRGLQVANVAMGGTLVAHMDRPHRHVVSELTLERACALTDALGTRTLSISCYHHQALDRLGDGLVAVAWSGDGTVEAVEMVAADAPWFLGVQWHPEDTAATDPAQMAIFAQLVAASRRSLQPSS